jgi:cell division protein FtsB
MNVWDRLSCTLSYTVITVVVLGAAAWTFFQYLPLFQTNNQLRKQIYVLDAKIQEQERFNRQVRANIDAVQKDPRTVERLARARLSFARTNETVFRFDAPGGR